MRIPPTALDAETLTSLLEEFVTRDGTDYGEQEVPLATRVVQVRSQLERGDAVIWFDEATTSVSILSRQALKEMGLDADEDH